MYTLAHGMPVHNFGCIREHRRGTRRSQQDVVLGDAGRPQKTPYRNAEVDFYGESSIMEVLASMRPKKWSGSGLLVFRRKM